MEELQGYRGLPLEILRKAGVKVGDMVRVQKDDYIVEGLLMPRIELGDPDHLVIKLANGYNVGIKVSSQTKVEKIFVEEKPSTATVEFKVEEREDLPVVSIIGTGGTIASRVEYRTGAVYPSLTTEDLYRAVPELSSLARIKTKVLFNVFSENITPKHWSEIAKTVAQTIEEGVEGVVVAHGTDTMGYTAAALSFALQNLPVPVVLVGSQRSSDRPSSDAALNLIGAVKTAAYAPFAEVVVAMHEGISDDSIVLHRGTKVRKCHTSRRDAFQSVNITPLARIVDKKITMLLNEYRKRGSEKKVDLKPDFNEKVALVKFYPGLNPELINWFVEKKFLGLILEGTGLGHVSRSCFEAIKLAVDNGMVVAMTSQCIWGSVRMTVYDTGRDLLSLGVIPLEDILPETALVKMMWAFGQSLDPEEVKKIMFSNLVGEYSYRLTP